MLGPLVALAAATSVSAMTPQTPEAGALRPFRVEDGIQLQRFEPQSGGTFIPSPDGSHLFFVQSRGDLSSGHRVFTLSVVDAKTAKTAFAQGRPLTPSDVLTATLQTATNDGAISQARWIDNGQAIAFLGVSGAEKPQVYRFDLSSRRLERITNATQGVTGFDLNRGACIYTARVGTEADRDRQQPVVDDIRDRSLLSIIAPEEAAEFKWYATFVSRGGGVRQIGAPQRTLVALSARFFISPDGHYAVMAGPPVAIPANWSRYDPTQPKAATSARVEYASQFQLINLYTGERSPLVDAPTGAAVGNRSTTEALWSPDGARVVLTNTLRPLGGDTASPNLTAAVLEFDLTGGRPAPPREIPFFETAQPGESLRDIRWNSDDLVITSSNGAQALETTADRSQTTWTSRFSSKSGAWRLAERETVKETGPGVRLGSLVFGVKEDANTPQLLVARSSSGREKVLQDLNPQLHGVEIRRIEPVRWTDNQGHQWTGGLILPAAAARGRVPVVLELKFFDPRHFAPDGPYTTAFASQALAASGIAVLQIDNVGPSTYGTEQEGSTQFRGIESALDYLQARGVLDPQKVGMIGFSRTSYYVAYTLTHTKRRFAAATIADGLDGGYMQYQLYTLNHFGGALGSDFAKMQGGIPFGEGLETWRRTSSIFNLDKVQAPLRIEMLGYSSVLQEWELYSSLRLLRKPVDAIFIPDATHVLVKPFERMASQGGNLDWYRFWLQGYEDPDPAKAGQYVRWRELRAQQQSAVRGR